MMVMCAEGTMDDCFKFLVSTVTILTWYFVSVFLLNSTIFIVSKNIENVLSTFCFVHILLFFKQQFVCYDIQCSISFMRCITNKDELYKSGNMYTIFLILESHLYSSTLNVIESYVAIPNTKSRQTTLHFMKVVISIAMQTVKWE